MEPALTVVLPQDKSPDLIKEPTGIACLPNYLPVKQQILLQVMQLYPFQVTHLHPLRAIIQQDLIN